MQIIMHTVSGVLKGVHSDRACLSNVPQKIGSDILQWLGLKHIRPDDWVIFNLIIISSNLAMNLNEFLHNINKSI